VRLAPLRAIPPETRAPGAKAVRRELELLLSSTDFDASRRSRDFLQYIVEETLAGRGEALTQGAIAARVFGRKDDFDALVDPIVRIQAGRLRRSLERYYLLAGQHDLLRIDLVRGSYVPAFRKLVEAPAVAPVPEGGALPDAWPALVVRPFEGSPGDAAQADFAARLTEDLAAELGRYQGARVLLQGDLDTLAPSPRVGARFELRGRARHEREGWRVAAQLVDRTTGEQLWGEEYHTSLRAGRGTSAPEDIPRVIAARVGSEHGVIVQALAGEYRRRPSAVTGAYAALVRSYDFFFTRQLEDLPLAVQALQRVVAEEPEVPLAWTQLARLYLVNHAFELSDLDTPLDQSISFAQQALRLDPSSARTRCVLASALLVKGELQAGREQLQQALRLNPGSLVYLEIIGYLMVLLGDSEQGVALIRSAMERNPHYLPHAHFGLWADHLRRGELEEAYQAALQYRDATFFWRSLMRASCLGLLGRTAEAHAEVAELLPQKPSFPERGGILIANYIKPVELRERIAEGLRKGGLALD
jgi:TolB-like protein